MEDVDVTGEVIGIISKAGRLSLNMSAVLELTYDKIKKCSSARLVIPVFRNLFFGQKKRSCQDS